MTVTEHARIRSGIHTNAADFTSTPGTLTVLECIRQEGLLPRGRTVNERPRNAIDGRRLVGSNGVKDLGPITLGHAFRGVSSNTGGALTWQNLMEQARLLDSFFGTAAVASSGAKPTSVTIGSGTPVLEVSSTVVATGDMILFQTSTGSYIREVISGGGSTTLTLDRAFPGTVTNGADVIRLARWDIDTSVVSHAHMYFEAEWRDFARRYYGCAPESFELLMPAAGAVEMNTVWQPSDWDDLTEVDPSYAAPTAGSDIIVANSEFWIGDNKYLLEDAKLSCKNVLRYRAVTSAANGRLGAQIVKKHDVMLTGRLFIGDNQNSIGELVDDSGTPTLSDLLEDAESGGTFRDTSDIALQVGTEAGSGLYIRIPAADIRAKPIAEGGVSMAQIEAYACGPASGSKSLRLGVL